MDDSCGGVQGVNLCEGLRDGIADHNEVLFGFGSGLGAVIVQELSRSSLGADAALAVARDLRGVAWRKCAYHFVRAGSGDQDFRVKRILGDNADIAVTESVRAALRVGGWRRGCYQKREARSQARAGGVVFIYAREAKLE
jgi:hypothetical protein